MSDSWPVCSDRLARLRCFHRSRSTNSARRRRIDTTRGALHEIFLVHGVGTVNACWCWSCRSRRQSRGARGRSYKNRSAEIAGSAQPKLQRLNQAHVRGRQWWQWYFWPCPSGLQPSEHAYTTRTEGASPYIPKNPFPLWRSCTGPRLGNCTLSVCIRKLDQPIGSIPHRRAF